jgi:peroxiredoxin
MKNLLRMIAAVAVLSFTLPVCAAATPAPDFEAQIFGGETFKLSAMKGKKAIVLTFAQTACATCRQELKFLNDFVGQSKAYEIYMVNVDAIAGTDRWNKIMKAYSEQQELKMKILVDPKMAIGRSFGVRSTPTTVIVDKEGNVMETLVGYSPDDNSHLEKLIKKIK